MADLLVFSAIVSSSPSFVAVAGAAADRLVMEFAVDHWTMWRTSLLHLFLFLVGATADHFFWNHIVYLLVNEENQPFAIIMVALEI